VIHYEGVVIARTRVPDGTNEITQVEALLKNILATPGRTIVMFDAAHTRRETASYLKARRGIDYVTTAKGNRPTPQSRFSISVGRSLSARLTMLSGIAPADVERRSTWITGKGGIDFPYASQVAVIRRDQRSDRENCRRPGSRPPATRYVTSRSYARL
jgi:hypothetical protein